MYVDGDDVLRRVSRDFLDVHAARRGCDESSLAALAVQHQAQVRLACDCGARLHVDLIDRKSFRTRLPGDEMPAQHGRGCRANRIEVLRELYPAGLAAPAGMHLCLHYPERTAQL